MEPTYFAVFNEAFMPHGHCYLWTPGILYPSLIYDFLIAVAYFSISISIRQERKLPDENWAQYLFISFILLCGMTHLMDMITVYAPAYYLQNSVKGLCAGVSVCTALAMRLRKKR